MHGLTILQRQFSRHKRVDRMTQRIILDFLTKIVYSVQQSSFYCALTTILKLPIMNFMVTARKQQNKPDIELTWIDYLLA